MYWQFKIHLFALIPRPDSSISKHFIGYSLFAWGLPGVLLIISFAMQYSDKSKNLLNTGTLILHNCWFLDNSAFYVGFVIPCGIFLLLTFWYLICSTISVYRAVTIQLDRKVRNKMLQKRRMQICLFLKITLTIYGVVILGIVYRLQDNEYTRISYHVVQGLEGIVVAIMVTCNCQVLKLYSNSMKHNKKKIPQMYRVDKKILDKSTSMQLLTWESPPDIV